MIFKKRHCILQYTVCWDILSLKFYSFINVGRKYEFAWTCTVGQCARKFKINLKYNLLKYNFVRNRVSKEVNIYIEMPNVYENLFHQHAYISVYTIHLFRNVDMVKRTFCQPTTVLHFFPFCISFFFEDNGSCENIELSFQATSSICAHFFREMRPRFRIAYIMKLLLRVIQIFYTKIKLSIAHRH